MILLYNGQIYTQNAKCPVASAIAIQNERVLFCGSDHDAVHTFHEAEEKIDLNGQTVLPGLCDAHMHLEYYALNLQRVNCETNTLHECLKRVEERAQKTVAGAWILGHGWNQNLWDNRFGSANELDQVAQDHPVYLTAKSYHAAWVNSVVLQLAGISPHTPDPEGGKIGRDDSGKPTGILFESAMELVKHVLPQPDLKASMQAIDNVQTTLWEMGITAVHDFDFGGSNSFPALQELDKQNKLHLRVTKGIAFERLEHALQVGLRSGFGSDYLKVGSIKLFADGALGPQTAAMLAPYDHSTASQNGFLTLDSEQVFEYGQKATQNGLSLAIHAIGDRANHEVISGLSQVRQFEKTHHLPGQRHRIEHVQLLHPDDINKLAELDLIASVQPLHATSDMDIADHYWGERCKFSYAYRSLLNSGAHMAFGSDAPVENPNPFLGLHAAVTRRRHDGYPQVDGWYPQERLSLQQALDGFTTGAAYASGQEDHLGKLTCGHFADLIILETDPFKIDPQELWQVKPKATMVAGQWVWMS